MAKRLKDSEINELINGNTVINFEEPIIGTYRDNNNKNKMYPFRINKVKVDYLHGEDSGSIELVFEFNPKSKNEYDMRSYVQLRFKSIVNICTDGNGELNTMSYEDRPSELCKFLISKFNMMDKSTLIISHNGTEFLIGEKPDDDNNHIDIWIAANAEYTSGVITEAQDKSEVYVPTKDRFIKEIKLNSESSRPMNDPVQLKAFQEHLMEAIDNATKEWNNELHQYQLQLRTKILDLLKI